jgi:hypothetical protein
MTVDNTKKIKLLKRIFYIGAAIWAISSLCCFLIGKDLVGFLTAGMLVIWFLAFQFIDFQYILFELSNNRLSLRYYPVVKFGRRDYSSIEFPVSNLYDYRLEKSVFGLVDDLILIVKTKQGVAEFPPVSMAALNHTEQQTIKEQLTLILQQ